MLSFCNVGLIFLRWGGGEEKMEYKPSFNYRSWSLNSYQMPKLYQQFTVRDVTGLYNTWKAIILSYILAVGRCKHKIYLVCVIT